MKFTLSWLKEHLETTASQNEIVDALVRLGLEVEQVTDPGAALKDFIVAEVISANPHPNADKLRVCLVNTGREKLQVVCGAPNARTGMKSVFAGTGLTVPGTGLTLKATEIRGVASNGMLCSAREMGLSQDHDGIIDLPADAPVGKPFAPVIGLDDPVIEIKITPNRQDCLGVRGIARDLAAAGLGKVKSTPGTTVTGTYKSPIGVTLQFSSATTAACPMFVGRHIRGVKNGPSPQWLQDRLRAIGLRPISALVDITNFVTFDLNRPLHVFDAGKISGDIHVRLARSGEVLLALDGKTYSLDPEICVVCDDKGPQGLGGVMGGADSGVSETTQDVFLEAALFDPVRTAATGRRLGINSDARYRFERGVDPEFVISGMEVATRLVLDLCGGTASTLVVAGAVPDWKRDIVFDPALTEKLGGHVLAPDAQYKILQSLGFGIAPSAANVQAQAVTVSPPSWRSDIDGPADLVEEVLRVAGYDQIPSEPLPRRPVVARPAISLFQRRVRFAKRVLASRGLLECVTYSFMNGALAAQFGGGGAMLKLANPIAAELDTMRPSILPNLLQAAARNIAQGQTAPALFEVGPIYADDTGAGQAVAATGLRSAMNGPKHWDQAARPVDAFDAKADSLALIDACGLAKDSVQIAQGGAPWFHPGRSGTILLGPKTVLGWFGELHPALLTALDISVPVVGFEVILDRLPAPKQKAQRTRPSLNLSHHPAVERDFAFLIDRDIPAQQVVKAVRSADRVLITDVQIFDRYQGPGVDKDKVSLGLSVRLEPKERTMTDAEIDDISQKIVAAVVTVTGAKLRT